VASQALSQGVGAVINVDNVINNVHTLKQRLHVPSGGHDDATFGIHLAQHGSHRQGENHVTKPVRTNDGNCIARH
jgi:hypothetical protein